MASANSDASVLPAEKSSLYHQTAFRRMLRKATLTLLAALGVPLLIALGLVEYLRISAAWVDHTERVISRANRVEKLLVTMQSGFRGYRLMRDPELLGPFNNARAEFDPRIQELHDLVADNPSQKARAEQFDQQAHEWLKTVDATLGRLKAGGSPESELTYLLASRKLINAALGNAEALVEEEEQLRVERQARLDQVVMIITLLFGISAVIGIPAFSVWLRNLLRAINGTYGESLAAAVRRATELEVTLNSIGDAVIATDAEGRIEFLNPVAETLTGWTSAEARGRGLQEVFVIFSEDTGAVVENPVKRVLRDNVVVGLANHTVLRSRKGLEHPIEDSAAPIRGARGEVLGVILVFHDVGTRRETERLLEQSERRLSFLNDLGESTRLLTDPVDIMKVSTRMLGQHLHVSRCVYAEVELDGDKFAIWEDYTDGCASVAGDYRLELFGPKTATEMRSGRTLVVRNLANELEGDPGAGMYHAMGVRALVCRPLVKQGRLRAMMAVHQASPRVWTLAEIKLIEDVIERCWSTVERARAEVALREAKAQAEDFARGLAESAERFRLIAGVVSMQVWTAKLNGEFDYANHECAQYFGVDVEKEVLGNAWSQFVHPEDLPFALDGWLASISSGVPYQTEFRLRNRHGVYRWFLVRAVAMRDSHGKISKWFGTNTDIDDLKQAQAEAERASRAKDDFIAALSHELRTPLTPVLMTAAALRDDARLPVEVREQLGMMERNIALEARLIDDLLDLTIIARGKLHLRAAPVDAHSLIGLAVEIVRDDARTKDISIERQLDAPRSGLMADPARFQQVIWNLLRNAVKFTPRGGVIKIVTSEIEEAGGRRWLRVTVSDSGIGIQPEMLEKIFRPFDQGGLTGDHRFGGVGLGLAIARAVVDLHGGRIRARSEGHNLGATFVAEFPDASQPPHGVIEPAQLSLPIPSAVSTPPMPLPVSPPPRAPLRLLLVEDHEATLQVLLRLLTREGHQVTAAHSVAGALAAAERGTFDLVISDLGLPDGTGIELMKKLRAIYRLSGIALSGYGMEEDLVRSRDAGFVAHLIKPVDFSQLKRAVEMLSV